MCKDNIKDRQIEYLAAKNKVLLANNNDLLDIIELVDQSARSKLSEDTKKEMDLILKRCTLRSLDFLQKYDNFDPTYKEIQ